jgi:protoporphyrinogen oxidase
MYGAMAASCESFDAIVLGAGRRGLAAALAWRRRDPGGRLLVVDAAPVPGGSIRTLRTNGFVCEMGRFAFTDEELAPLLALLEPAPTPIPALPGAASGWLRTQAGNQPLQVAPKPWTFRSGNEELVQACRRALGGCLRLGRSVAAVDHDGAEFLVHLAGDPPSTALARALHVALPVATAGRLLARFDPALGEAATRIASTARAFAFFGGDRAAAPELRGYGILAAEDQPSPLAEAIFCSEVFPARALAGRFLVRAELVDAPADASDEALLASAAAELRAWTGIGADFPLQRLHRFAAPDADGAFVECRTRLHALPARVPGLHVL